MPTAPGLRPLVINVEYNQLDALLQTSASGGDVADATGYSPYPGNVNTLVMKLGPYAQVLTRTRTDPNPNPIRNPNLNPHHNHNANPNANPNPNPNPRP